MTEYWLISAPGDKTCQQTWETMNNLTSKQNSLSVNYKFHIPDLKVGTLDQLVGLSDDLGKLDGFVEQVTRKVASYLGEVLEDQRDKLQENLTANNNIGKVFGMCLPGCTYEKCVVSRTNNTLLNESGGSVTETADVEPSNSIEDIFLTPPQSPLDNSTKSSCGHFQTGDLPSYITRFQWDIAKYPTKQSLRSIADIISKQVGQIDADLKTKSTAYNNLKGSLQSLEKKQTGSLLTRNLADLVKKEHFILDSEYLTTLLVIVPKQQSNEWQALYEKLTDMVVPRSSQLITHDHEYGLYTVSLFKKVAEEFKLHAREKKFIVRDFTYNEEELAAGKNEITKLVTDKKKQFGPLVRWLKVNFSECFCAWIHVKALRVFVESVLRYGLPVNFQAILLHPSKKSVKRLRDVLNQLYGHLDSSALQASSGADENLCCSVKNSTCTTTVCESSINNDVNKETPSSECLVPCATTSIIPTSSSQEMDLILMETPTISTRPVKRKRITDYIDHLHTNEEDDLNKALAKFIFGCNVPFALVENAHFKNFIKKLRPAYEKKMPSRKLLSTTLLDDTYNNIITETSSNLDSESVCLLDGWKNSVSNAKTVVCVLHNANGTQAFLNAWDLSGESETGEKLSEIVGESVGLAKELYGTTIYAVVSDNASAMIKMGELMSHVVWHSTCSSHTGNLLAKDVVEKEITLKVTMVLKEFKKTDLEKFILIKGGKKIKIPCETRWCTYRDAYMSFIDNLPFMKKAVAADAFYTKKISQEVKQLIFDDLFIETVQEHIELFNPICKLINECQRANCSIAEAAHMWLNLILPLKYRKKYNSKLELRKKMALNIYALTALYLHPFLDKNKLGDYKKDINRFLIQHLDSNGIEDLDKFQMKSGVFKLLCSKNLNNPTVFWRMALFEHPNLSKLALKLLKIPASSAQVERAFSNWGNIHTGLRNRLTFDKSKKLLHIFYSLKINEDEDKYISEDVDEECYP